MRILVVEDEKRIADFLSRGLESAGYAIDVAYDGAHAIDMVHATEYDLVILDLGLPDMDGLTVLQRIRNRKVTPPVLILERARYGRRTALKALELGADDYLVKPFAFGGAAGQSARAAGRTAPARRNGSRWASRAPEWHPAA